MAFRWTEFAVRLTAAHLEQGDPRKCATCPLALAIAETIGGWRFVGVAVDGRVIVKAPHGRHVPARVRDPVQVAAIVRAVDAGHAASVPPQTVVIACPFPALTTLD